jgi:hypothetical protein
MNLTVTKAARGRRYEFIVNSYHPVGSEHKIFHTGITRRDGFRSQYLVIVTEGPNTTSVPAGLWSRIRNLLHARVGWLSSYDLKNYYRRLDP